MSLRKSLVYFLILATIGSLFTYRIIVKAYDNNDALYDIEQLKN